MTATDGHESINFDRLMTEINEEVRRRRQAGDFPPGVERELDEVFAQFAPKKVSLDDLSDLMAKVEQASFLDSDAPTTSLRKGGAVIKQSIARGVGWYVRYLAQNTTVFASTVARVLRLLDDKIEVVNESVFRQPSEVAATAAAAPRTPVDLTAWRQLVVDTLSGTAGRVLHTESGRGDLVGALIDAGVDAYGVEPSESMALGSASTALDVRIDAAVAHLRSLPDEGLAALVLSDCVDRLTPFEQLEVAKITAAKTARGGTVIVFSRNPAGSIADLIAADLSPGAPLHAETWQYLLTSAGLEIRGVHWEDTGAGLTPLDPAVDGAAAFNDHLDRLNEALFPSPTYAIVASRPRPA